MLPAQRTPWQDTRILTILLMVFLAGAGSGAIAMRVSMNRKLHNVWFWPKESAITLTKLQQELNLSPDQSAKVKTILDDMVRYREDIDSSAESYRAIGKHRILDVLTAEQRKRFEELSKSLQDR